MRLVSLFCGHTALAASAVLAAFMGGLAAGSLLGGKVADAIPRRRLLALYILLELGIGVAGLITKPALAGVGRAALRFGVIELAPALQIAVYFGLSCAVLIIPATLMGASLPVLTRWMSLRGEDRAAAGGGDVEAPDAPLSLLYGLNTFGAVLGALAAGFALMPLLGTTRSLLFAAGVNAVCAGLGLAVWTATGAKGGRPSAIPGSPSGSWGRPPEGGQSSTPSGNPLGSRGPRAVAAGTPIPGPSARAAFLLLLTGAAAMVCEVAWTRAFSLVMGSTTYAFTVMLATFLLGLSLGSVLFHVLRRRFAASSAEHRHARPAQELRSGRGEAAWGGLAILLALAGLSVFSGLFFFERLPYILNTFQSVFYADKNAVFAVQFQLAAAIMLIPATLMGAVLPWAAACSSPSRERIGSVTGIFYAANTLGAILGSVGAGLLLLPAADIERSLVIAVWLYGISALIALGAVGLKARSRYSLWAAAGLALAVMTALRPSWDLQLFGAGKVGGNKPGQVMSYEEFKGFHSDHKVLFQRSGTNATVTVFEQPFGGRYLGINGKTDASEGGDMDTQLLLGYLPLLLHGGKPKSALVVGLGGGITVGALASSPELERLDVVEIEPMVVEGARLFGRSNHHALEDPRVRLRFADARQFFAAPGPDYDIISSEPSNPWIAGIAYLYTREAFALARERLADDGVFVQWFHSYIMSDEDFRMVVRTFSSVFPHMMVFSNGASDYYLIGSKSPWDIGFADIERVLAGNRTMREDLAVIGKGYDHPAILILSSFLLDEEDVVDYVKDAPIHADDRPTLEFSAAKNIYLQGGAEEIMSNAGAASKRNLPRGLRGFPYTDAVRALAFNVKCERWLDADKVELAAKDLKKAMRLDPVSAYGWMNRGHLFEKRGEPENALAAYSRAVSLDPNFGKVRIRLGLLHDSQGRQKKSLAEFQKALALSPADPMASLGVGWGYVELGEKAEARRVLESALERPIPDSTLRAQIFETLERARK